MQQGRCGRLSILHPFQASNSENRILSIRVLRVSHNVRNGIPPRYATGRLNSVVFKKNACTGKKSGPENTSKNVGVYRSVTKCVLKYH